MNRHELDELWGQTLRLAAPNVVQFERLAQISVEVYESGDLLPQPGLPQFKRHMQNRLKQIAKRTGEVFDANSFDLHAARLVVADEVGFADWDELVDAIKAYKATDRPILFQYAIAAMERGDFSALESMVGGPDRFDEQITDWDEKGYFETEPETLGEVFSAACMLGYDKTVAYLLDKGVDPLGGIKTGLNGFHYAAASGRLAVIKQLIERKVSMEIKNMYGGTVFEQAIWSAINEYTPNHAAIVEALIEAGAVVDDGYVAWWEAQNVPDAETKRRVGEVLHQHQEFHARITSAEKKVDESEVDGGKRMIADSLKALGNLLRRPPFLRDRANEAYGRAANLYDEIGLPLEAAWVKRHIGINHEYAGRLEDAEKYYDEALALYREHSTEDDLNYANAVRYPAVIKERLGKKGESAQLWEESHDRYAKVHPDGLGEGVAEAAAWLTILSIERDDLDLASKWFARASEASGASGDPDTHKFIFEVKTKLESKQTEG